MPNIGQVITLQVAAVDEQEASRRLRSRIANEQGREFWIETPIDEDGRMRVLHEGDALSISYMSAGATFYFNTHVTGRKQENGIRFFTIEKPLTADITRVQRRNFLRVDADLDVAVRMAGNKRFLAVTQDISGGGLSMITREPVRLHAEDMLDCWVLIPYRNGSIEHVPLTGAIVRTKSAENGLLIMLRFTEIMETDRQKIVRFCFEKQLELRK